VLDAWAAEQNEIATARARIENSPQLKEKVYALAGQAVRAERGSGRGAATLHDRSQKLGHAVIAALRHLDSDFPCQYWDGDMFLLGKACARLATHPPEQLSDIVADAFVSRTRDCRINERNLKSWALRVRPRTEWTRDTFGAVAPLPRAPESNDAVAVYRAERAKRTARRQAGADATAGCAQTSGYHRTDSTG
jgi:hypothetical protein